MNNNILKNYIKKIILFEQKSNKYNIFIDAVKNSNKSDLLSDINETEISNKLSNLKKYQFEWILNYIQSDILEAEGLGEIIQIVIDFDKFKNTLENKELSSYKTVNDIRKELEKPSKRQLKRNKRLDLQSEYEIVYEDDEIIIYFPHSEKASCEIANRMGFGGVTWCTAAEKSENYFFNYSLYEGFNIYYILSKTYTSSNMDKVSIGIKDNQIGYNNNVTVNSSNRNLNKNDLEDYFGKVYWDKLEGILLTFNKKYEEHPSIKYLERIRDIAKYSKDRSIKIKLSRYEDPKIRSDLASNPNLDKEVQLILAKDENKDVRNSLASNPNLDKEVQLILAKDANEYVRRNLSYYNTNTDKKIQLILAKDASGYVRRNLAYNTNTDKKIQLILSKDENKDVRGYLASNSNLDKEVQLRLAKDKSYDVKSNLLKNLNIDPEIKEMLENKYE